MLAALLLYLRRRRLAGRTAEDAANRVVDQAARRWLVAKRAFATGFFGAGACAQTRGVCARADHPDDTRLMLHLLLASACSFAPRHVAPLGAPPAASSRRAAVPHCAAIELSRPPFIQEDVIDSNTGQPLKIDPRNDAWLPIVVSSSITERLPEGALRFVEEGTGTVSAGGEEFQLEPDTMITVIEDTELMYTKTSDSDFTLLTPDYWQPQSILARAAGPYVFGAFALLGIGNAILDAVNGA